MQDFFIARLLEGLVVTRGLDSQLAAQSTIFDADLGTTRLLEVL